MILYYCNTKLLGVVMLSDDTALKQQCLTILLSSDEVDNSCQVLRALLANVHSIDNIFKYNEISVNFAGLAALRNKEKFLEIILSKDSTLLVKSGCVYQENIFATYSSTPIYTEIRHIKFFTPLMCALHNRSLGMTKTVLSYYGKYDCKSYIKQAHDCALEWYKEPKKTEEIEILKELEAAMVR